MLALFGLITLLLGFACGGVLLATGFGLMAQASGLVLWLLFPALLAVGYTLFVMGAQGPQIRSVSTASAGLLLLLAMVALVALVGRAIGVVPSAGAGAGPSASLWVVLILGVLLGPVALVVKRAPDRVD
jgi:hypothetical protein